MRVFYIFLCIVAAKCISRLAPLIYADAECVLRILVVLSGSNSSNCPVAVPPMRVFYIFLCIAAAKRISRLAPLIYSEAECALHILVVLSGSNSPNCPVAVPPMRVFYIFLCIVAAKCISRLAPLIYAGAECALHIPVILSGSSTPNCPVARQCAFGFANRQ